jgi:tetratricopeptide (TPR) repeat protein
LNSLNSRYRIVSPIGAGGMGEVFLAEDLSLERRVAVKVLAPAAEADPIARERFRREALSAAALDHPFICKIHEIGDADGRLFIVMEYVEGETLHAAARRDLLPAPRVIEIATELAEALDAAHRRSIIHRDLKPSNVMLTPQGHVKVMDFGLAKQLDARTGTNDRTPTLLTGSGTRLGTPAYMSPEQVLGGALDPRSDVFSLGVMLHELATGRHPFLRDTAAETMTSILRDPPLAGTRDADLVDGFAAVVARTLAKACAERYQSMSELLADLSGLRARAWSSSASAAVKAPAPQAERTPFVGRDAEAVDLSRLLDRMLTGQGGLVLIGGEPGVGKTRLAREVMAVARQRGCLCLTGHCYEMEGAPPYMPFVEITEESVRLVPQAVRAAMGDMAAEIAAMAPSLRRVYRDIPPAPDVPPNQLRRLIFGAFLEYLQRAAQKSPGVFLLDDLHWADEPTLQLLLHVAPHLATMRILAIGTYRDVELDVKRPFAKTLESLLRQRLATRVTLRRLNESGVQHMLSAMSGSSAPTGLVKAVFRETEGNPFFIEEVYQHLREEGRLFDATGAWKADLRVDTIEVPEGVRLVIGRRLDRLGEHARKVLTAAAVIGRTFPLDLLQSVVADSEDAVLDAIEEAERTQLIAADAGQRTPRYGFVHELIRTTLIAGLSLPRRQRLHLKIADVLERMRSGSLESHASVLAHHLYQAGAAADAGRTAKFLLLAGRRSLKAGGFEETLDITENILGLELAEDDRLLGQGLEQRGEALAGLQRFDEAVAVFERALTLYEACGDEPGIERAARGAAVTELWRGRFADGVPPLTRGLAALSKEATRERLSLEAWLAAAYAGGGQIDEAWRRVENLKTHGPLEPELEVRTLFCVGFCCRACAEYEEAVAAGQRALGLLRAEALWDRTDAFANLLYGEYMLGRFAACDRQIPEFAAAAARSGHHGASWLIERLRSNIAFLRSGDVRAFGEEARQALELPLFRYIVRTNVGQALLYLGEIDRAFEQLQTVIAEQPPNHFFRGMPEGNLLAAAALAGQTSRAEALVDSVTALLPLPGQRNLQGAYYALDMLITALTLLGDRQRCGQLYPLAQEHLRTGTVISNLTVGPSNPQLAAALAADAAGFPERAHEHFEIAHRQAREVPMRILQPMALYWHGRSLAATGVGSDLLRGRGMVDAARGDFRALGLVLHAQLAERFLAAAAL